MNNEQHEFTLRREGGISVTVTCDGDANIEHVVEAMRCYLLAVGFAAQLVNEIFDEP